MRSRSDFLHRLGMLGVLALVAVVGVAGCSMTSPSDPWDGNTGSLEGTVSSDRGGAIQGIQVCLWAELGASQEQVEYTLVTDAQGVFEESEMDLGERHAFEATYEVYVNCTKTDQSAINDDYRTCITTVTLSTEDVAQKNVVLEEVSIGDVDHPADMFE